MTNTEELPNEMTIGVWVNIIAHGLAVIGWTGCGLLATITANSTKERAIGSFIVAINFYLIGYIVGQWKMIKRRA